MSAFRTLQWRIALWYTALIFAALGAVSIYLVDFVRDSYVADLEERLQQEAGLVGEAVLRQFSRSLDLSDLQSVSRRMGDLSNARVTIIARDGTVLADTWEDPARMENHGGRPEVRQALEGGLGRYTRVSATVGEEMLYTAVSIQVDGTVMGVARLAYPTSRISDNIRRIVASVALSALVVASLSVALAYLVARRTARSVRAVTRAARRLAAGDLGQRVEAVAPDETQELAHAFNRMAAALREMVQDLSAERNTLSAVMDTMSDGVVLLDQGGEVVLTNPAALRLLGLRDPMGAHPRFTEAVRDHDLQGLIARALQSGAQQHGEVDLLRPRRSVSAIATPLAGGDAAGVLLTLHDLTRLRQVETTRREFVSNVSHELRSPLASVRAIVETLEDGALEDSTVSREFLQRIHQEVDRMSSMVQELLELASLESPQAGLQPAPLELRPLVEEVVSQTRPRAEARGVAVGVLAPEGLPTVMGEAGRLRQVLVNLLDNAIRFTPDGGRVTVSARAVEVRVEVRVEDTGVGIPREHLPHVFERFYKVDRSRRDGGTGLGLAIVKHIVQAHGGQVGVESREGEGSTFTFTVPGAA